MGACVGGLMQSQKCLNWKRITGYKTINPITNETKLISFPLSSAWSKYTVPWHSLWIIDTHTHCKHCTKCVCARAHTPRTPYKVTPVQHFEFQFIWPIHYHFTYFSCHNNNNNHRDGSEECSCQMFVIHISSAQCMHVDIVSYRQKYIGRCMRTNEWKSALTQSSSFSHRTENEPPPLNEVPKSIRSCIHFQWNEPK